MIRHFQVLVVAAVFFFRATAHLLAQSPDAVARERADYLAWLKTAPNSPLAAVAQQPLGGGIRLGPPDADIPLTDLPEHRVIPKDGSATLHTPSGSRPLGHGRAVELGGYTLYLSSSASGPVVTVFGEQSGRKQPPGYYEYDSSLVFTGPLLAPSEKARVRVLTADGIETEAADAGSIVVPLGPPARLKVLRIPTGAEESELEIFFRDETNGHGSYPAGRFVDLIPLPSGEYRLDFNRARNPFCAYNSVYPCPAPWRGNALSVPVRAGERYAGGGLENPPVRRDGE